MNARINLIGEGGYGCVIQPVIQDKYTKTYIEYENKESNDIGKLFLERQHFIKELQLLQGIRILDNKSIFTVELKGANSFSSKSLNDSVLKCLGIDTYFDTDTQVFQIIMEYGGKDLHDLSSQSMPFKYFISYFKTFIEGLMKFHSYNMIHYDIKPANTLVSNKKISLIDFGISISADEMYSSENRNRLSSFYIYHPPEAVIASLLLDNNNSQSVFQDNLDTVIDDMRANGYFDEIWKDSKHSYVKEGLNDFITQLKYNNLSFQQVFNNEMAFKCDVYSLSFVIKEFSSKIKYDNDMQKEFMQQLYSMCSAINPLKRATMKQIIKFIRESETTIKNSSNNQIGGSKTRLRFAKLHKESSYNISQVLPQKYKLPAIVNKHLKRL